MPYFPDDVQDSLVTQFQGSAQASDPYALDAGHGLYSQNVEYVVGPGGNIQAQSRKGTSQVAPMPVGDGPVTALGFWYYSAGGSQIGLAIYYAPAVGIKYFSLVTMTFSPVVIGVTGAAYSSFIFNGVKALISFRSASAHTGAASGYITDAGSGNTDTLFAPPLSTGQATITVNTTAAVGVVTAGTKRVAFLYTTRNGYTGPICPVTSSLVLFPTTATAADGFHAWSVTIAFSPPAYMVGGFIQVVLTTSANPARYFAVPGTITPVTVSASYTIAVNISDGDLAATATDVTFYQNYLSQSIGGTPPFLPGALFVYSNRAGYCTFDQSGFPVVYFSEQNNYQALTAAYHGVYLEGRQIPIQGASLGAMCYIGTLSGLYATQDNGDLPATWTPPSRIDGSVGVLAPSCMLSVGGKILLASEKGLFLYRGGAFPAIPVSYWQQPDWSRINWLAASQVQVADDQWNRIIRVIAPLAVVITSASNTNPITITTAIIIGGKQVAYPHLFQTGVSVVIAGVVGNTAANGTRTITVTGANTFTIPVAGNGNYAPTQAPFATATPTTPNAELSWNYSPGDSPGQPYYSLNAFSSYRMGATCIVKNLANNVDEAWYAPAGSNPGGIIRRVLPTDPTPNRDTDMSGSAVGVPSLYETGLAPGGDQSATVHDFHGAHFRIYGQGSLNLTAYGLDHVRSLIPLASPVALSSAPGLEVLVKWFLRSEQQTIAFGTNAVDAYFVAALLRVYWTPSVPFR